MRNLADYSVHYWPKFCALPIDSRNPFMIQNLFVDEYLNYLDFLTHDVEIVGVQRYIASDVKHGWHLGKFDEGIYIYISKEEFFFILILMLIFYTRRKRGN
jgi:hypothetical protein